jgi:hypothetical protein
MSLAEARKNLAQRQAVLLQGLTQRGVGPAEMERLAVAADALLTKRFRAIARVWPALARSLGDEFEPRFRDFAHRTPLPETGGPLADGRAFARKVRDLSDEARLELLSVDLHWKRHGAGLVVRLGPTLKATWLRESCQVVIGLRLPWLGERWLSFGWRNLLFAGNSG